MKTFLMSSLIVSLAFCSGCESNPPTSTERPMAIGAQPPPAPAAPSSNATAAAPQPAAPAAPAQAPQAAPNQPAASAQGAVPPAAPPGPANNQPDNASAADGTLKKAEVGVGIKGKDYEPGFITTPIATKFAIEDRVALDVQIPKAMQLYKADHNNKGPKTHEEFWQVIIKDHGVELPVLAEGESYIYDPQTEELMVKTPKPQ